MARERVGSWVVFTHDDDGSFKHARNDDPNVRIAWSLDEFAQKDPDAFQRWSERARKRP